MGNIVRINLPRTSRMMRTNSKKHKRTVLEFTYEIIRDYNMESQQEGLSMEML